MSPDGRKVSTQARKLAPEQSATDTTYIRVPDAGRETIAELKVERLARVTVDEVELGVVFRMSRRGVDMQPTEEASTRISSLAVGR